MTFRSYKFRIYPTVKQEILINKTFGCARFVYNTLLGVKQDYYKKHSNLKGYKHQTVKELSKVHDFLKEVEHSALQCTVMDLDVAYNNYFRHIKQKQPASLKFKSVREPFKSFRTPNGHGRMIRMNFHNNKVRIAKVGWLKYRDPRTFTGTIKSATVTKTPTGKYFISILVEDTMQQLPPLTKKIGLDVGITTYATTSDGDKYDNPRVLKQYEEKLANAQRKLSKKKMGSNNYEKQRKKVARIHEKIANVRKDFQQKLSTRLINENQVIVVETLAVKGMVKNHCLAKAVSDCAWSYFFGMLEYKADWYGRQFIKIDKWFPSTKLCSNCHYKNDNLTLADRTWSCEVCKTKHDRDINAAVNILTVGTTGSACVVPAGSLLVAIMI